MILFIFYTLYNKSAHDLNTLISRTSELIIKGRDIPSVYLVTTPANAQLIAPNSSIENETSLKRKVDEEQQTICQEIHESS